MNNKYFMVRYFNESHQPFKREFVTLDGITSEMLDIIKTHRIARLFDGSLKLNRGFNITEHGITNVFTREQVNATYEQHLHHANRVWNQVSINDDNNDIFTLLLLYMATSEWHNDFNP